MKKSFSFHLSFNITLILSLLYSGQKSNCEKFNVDDSQKDMVKDKDKEG